MQHVIKKQIVNLVLPKELNAFQMQQFASTHYYKDVLPLLEKVFDELSNENELIEIEQLEIDLGMITLDEMKMERWSDKVLLKIKEQLKEKIGVKKQERNDYVSRKKSLTICRQWLFYMEKAQLPWNTLQLTASWYNNVLEALAVDYDSVAALRKLIIEKPIVARRIVLQHQQQFLTLLIEILTSTSQRDLQKAIIELQKMFSHTGSIAFKANNTKDNITEIWEEVLNLSAKETKLSTRLLIQKIAGNHLPNVAVIQPLIAERSFQFPVILPVIKKLADKPELISGKKSQKEEVDSKMQDSKPDDLEDGIDEEGVFVSLAGIVLTHPFLHSLFKKLQWIKEGSFENTSIQQKVLYMLHYLATGNTTAEEFELVIPKLLCNWPMEMPVEKNIELKEEELSEADNMLEALIEQWTVLKNTSIDGLRQGFLQRHGKLFKKNDKLYLQVESSTIDVLLDQLPWNLSIIKLPWMKELLRVEWR